MAITPRVLPSDLTAEAAVLGAILLSNKSLALVADRLVPEDFFLDHHAQVFRATVALFAKGSPLDLVTVSDELGRMKVLERIGGMVFLAELQDAVPTAANVEHYAEIVRGLSVKRALIMAANKTLVLGYDDGTSATMAVDQAQQAVFNAWSRRDGGTTLTMRELAKQAFEEIHARGGKPRGVQTGFYDLDKMTGGLRGGQLVLLAARPGIGKTSLVLNIAENAAKDGVTVAVFSMEMNGIELFYRLTSSRTQIEHHIVQSGILSDAETVRATTTLGELGELPIVIDESARIGTIELRARARRMKMTNSIGLIIVDYLQLMDAPKAESRVQEVTEISRSLKALARELNVPLIACSQLNREVEKREGHKPQLADLRESGALEQDADIVMFLHRPGLYDGSGSPDAELIVAKHRNGPVGVVELLFKPEQVKFLNKARTTP